MADVNDQKSRFEVIHIGKHGQEWIAVIWDRREKRIAGSANGKDLDRVVQTCRDLISSMS
jgi:hypothetical protein